MTTTISFWLNCYIEIGIDILKVAIMQPTYLPWYGYFSLAASCDVFVLLDDTQYERRSWQSRNRILVEGREYLLSLPVHSKGQFNQLISQVRMVNPFQDLSAHLETIRRSYSRAPYFKEFFPTVQNLFENNKSEFLVDFNESFILAVRSYLGLGFDTIRSSSLGVEGHKSFKLLSIVRKLNGDTYLSPKGSRCYIEDEGWFQSNRTPVFYQEITNTAYKQLTSDFIPQLSVVDLIFNEGKLSTLDYLKSIQSLIK